MHYPHAPLELARASGPHYRCEIGEGARGPTPKLCCSRDWGAGQFDPLVRRGQPPFEFDPLPLHTTSHEDMCALGKSHTHARGHIVYILSHFAHKPSVCTYDVYGCMTRDFESVIKIRLLSSI